MQLKDQVVVVTGAWGELGTAVTHCVLAQGARCAMLARHAQAVPEGAQPFQVDLSSREDAVRTMDAIASHFGRVDALVNVAGGFRWQGFESSTDLAEWHELFAMNVMTCVNASKAALPHLLREGRGRIVNIGALGGVKAAKGMGAYAASKAGVMRFTEALADEVKDRGVTVNAVMPSIIDTPRNRADMPNADASKWVTADDVARVIAFLLSDAGTAVNGALVPVSGRG